MDFQFHPFNVDIICVFFKFISYDQSYIDLISQSSMILYCLPDRTLT